MSEARMEDVVSEFNLIEAWLKVSKNAGCAGVDRETIEDFGKSLKLNLTTLRNEVQYKTYQPQPLLRVLVDKPSGGERPLSIPAVRDRVLQTAATQILTPVFETEFEDCSYAYRKGRSVDQAVRRVIRLRDEGYRWLVDADIFRYFDEINHDLLMALVEKLVKDEAILGLIRLWLKADVVNGNQRFRLRKGVPQGSPLSPLLSNLYLDQLDDALLDRDLRLVRFADDFLVLCKTRSKANDALEMTEEVLRDLRLKINEDKTSVLNFNHGFRFLGVEFVRSLALKSKYPHRVERDLIALPLTENPSSKSTTATKIQPTLNEISLAFHQAGISPQDFPKRPDHPVESEFPQAAENSEAPGTNYDPRLRTLYLLRHGFVLGKESERLVARFKGKVVKEIPAIKVDQVMVFGNIQITTQAMQYCLQESIPIFLLSAKGRYYGVVDSYETDPVMLHRDQFQRAEDPAFCLSLAREFVRGKISNCRLILNRQVRKRDAPAFKQTAGALKGIIKQLDKAESLDQLRGYEGNGAKLYFAAIAKTLDASWGFSKRARQPPTDPVNAMLSYGYTLLFYNVYSFIRARGLNPHVGYLHAMRAGHPALASDIIEEFRAIVVDAVVLKLVLNAQVSPNDFEWPKAGTGACLLNDQARGLFIKSLETKLNARIRHPVSNLRLDYRRCMEHQVDHLAAVIRGRDSRYRAMVLR